MFWFPGVTVDGRPPSTLANANYYRYDYRICGNYCYVRIFTNQNLKMRKWYIGIIQLIYLVYICR